MSTPELAVTTLQSPAEPSRRAVLMPGLGTEADSVWHPLSGELDPSWHVVALDLPGHGASRAWVPQQDEAAPSMESLAQGVLDAVCRDEAAHSSGPSEEAFRELPLHFAGISISGALALQLAADHPERFTSVANLCSLARIGEQETWAGRARTVHQEGTAAMVEGNRARWFAPGFAEREPETVERTMAGLMKADDLSYATLCHVLGTFDLRTRLSEIALPVLAVAAEHDVVAEPAAVGELAEQIPGGRQILVEGVSHQAAVEKPEQIADILNDFFGGSGVPG